MLHFKLFHALDQSLYALDGLCIVATCAESADGTVSLDAEGNERKSICYRDLDAIGAGRRAGLEFAFITAEDTRLARFIANRFGVSECIFGAKDKGKAFCELAARLGLAPEEVCYIGDSDRDVAALDLAGIAVAPADATAKAKAAADFVTKAAGGGGVLWETVERIAQINGEQA